MEGPNSTGGGGGGGYESQYLASLNGAGCPPGVAEFAAKALDSVGPEIMNAFDAFAGPWPTSAALAVPIDAC